MPFIPFPDVPVFPGVPTLASFPGLVNTSSLIAQLLTSDDPNVLGIVSSPVWGLYDGFGSVVVEADSVISISYNKEYRVCDYPVEPSSTDQASGTTSFSASFEAYNKVEMPYQIHLVLVKGGSDNDRNAFQISLDNAAASLDLYSVITPDYTFNNANVVGVNFERKSSNGVTLLMAEVLIQQIRITGSTQFTPNNTADPASADQQSDGTVYPQSSSLADTSDVSVI